MHGVTWVGVWFSGFKTARSGFPMIEFIGGGPRVGALRRRAGRVRSTEADGTLRSRFFTRGVDLSRLGSS